MYSKHTSNHKTNNTGDAREKKKTTTNEIENDTTGWRMCDTCETNILWPFLSQTNLYVRFSFSLFSLSFSSSSMCLCLCVCVQFSWHFSPTYRGFPLLTFKWYQIRSLLYYIHVFCFFHSISVNNQRNKGQTEWEREKERRKSFPCFIAFVIVKLNERNTEWNLFWIRSFSK